MEGRGEGRRGGGRGEGGGERREEWRRGEDNNSRTKCVGIIYIIQQHLQHTKRYF